jgi:uncharacterized protein (DUF1501 family)
MEKNDPLYRPGKTLKHEHDHACDHHDHSRRHFLWNMGALMAGSAMLPGGLSVQSFMPRALPQFAGAGDGERILVLIQLKGGNDGLNTIVPRGNSEYYKIRPTLGIQPADMWNLSPEFGMPRVTQPLQKFWQDGKMKIIHNVGYPDPNYSHFRSTDIWATSSDSDEVRYTGWLGRLLDDQFPSFLEAQPSVPPALQIGVETNLIFRGPTTQMALSLASPAEFYRIARSGVLYDLNFPQVTPRDSEKLFMRQVANRSFRYSQSIKDAFDNGSNDVNYKKGNLSSQMAAVARMIKGNLGTRIYLVSIDGFDTHAAQYPDHFNLLQDLSQAVESFFQDLRKTNQSQNVMAMTFSEFGRTIYENGSLGTDHGTGSPMLMFSDVFNGSSFTGVPPDLFNVDPYGDPLFNVDFRSVYSTVLTDWLGVPPQMVNHTMDKEGIAPISNLIPPAPSGSGFDNTDALLGHLIGSDGVPRIRYSISRRGQVTIKLVSYKGQEIASLVNEFKEKGSYEVRIPNVNLPTNEYVCRMETGGKIYTQKMTKFRI